MKKKVCGIYQIQSRCKPERVYIGSSSNIASRWRGHLRMLGGGRHHAVKLQWHYDKYGADDLVFTILTECEKDVLVIIEQDYLDSLNPYFNIFTVADRPTGIRRPMSNETKMKISLANKGKIRSADDIMKNRLSHIGKKQSEETIAKRAGANTGKKRSRDGGVWTKHFMYGKHHSEETKEKMRLAATGRASPFKGTKRSESICRRISETKKRKFANGEYNGVYPTKNDKK